MIVTRPADVLDVRTHLLNWWDTPFAKVYGESWIESLGWKINVPLAAAFRSLLRTAECVYVPADVTASVWGLTDTHDLAPDWGLERPVLPSGVAYFVDPLLTTDIHGQYIATRVITWMTMESYIMAMWLQDVTVSDDLQTQMSKHPQSGFGRMESDFPMWHLDIYPLGVEISDLRSRMEPLEDIVRDRGPISKFSGLPFAETVPVSHADTVSAMLALFSLWEHLGSHVPAQIPRASSRRSLRAAPKAPQGVRVLTLPGGGSRGSGSHTEASEVAWSHRWRVRAHPRRLASGRVVQVRSHVKGPADAPLLDRPTVYTVR